MTKKGGTLHPYCSRMMLLTMETANWPLACRTSRFARPWQARFLQPAHSFVKDQSMFLPATGCPISSASQYSCEQQSWVAVWKTNLH